ncbi:MAG: hypothetical protein QXV01_11410 [Candidatus Bathyarchaeia archaeon]
MCPTKNGVISNLYMEVEAIIRDLIDKHYVVLISLVFFSSFLAKLLVISFSGGLGADYGAYLRWVDVLRGADIVGGGLRYPPLYPSLLIFFLIFLDEITALKTCTAFIYSLIAVPYFLLAKKIIGNNIFLLIASLLITFNMFYSEMMGWGGNANVLGFVFLTTFLIFWINSLKNIGSKRNIFLAAFFLSLAVGSHYLLAAYIIVFFFVVLFLILLLRHEWSGASTFKNLIKTVLIIGLNGLILSIPYLFTYRHLLNSAVFYETSLNLADQRMFGLSVHVMSQNLFNIVFLTLGVIGILSLIKKDKLIGLTLAALFISGCLPIFFTLHPARWIYFWPIPIFLGFPVFIKNLLPKLRKSHRILRAISTTGMVLLISTYIFCSVPLLSERLSYYNILTPKVLDALEYLRANTTANSVIATSGPYRRGGEGSGHNYGWWIEGYADRKSVATAYLRFLIYYDEREIAEKANILFSGTHVLLNDFVMAAETLPADLGNPEIGINIGDFYDKLLFFADNETVITFSHNSDSYNLTLRDFKTKSPPMISSGSNGVNITYSCNSTVINKLIRISGDATIEISFELKDQDDGIDIKRIFIPLFKADFTDLNGYRNISDKNKNITLEIEITTSMGAYVKLNVTVDYARDVMCLEEKGQEFAIFIFDNPEDATIKFTFNLPKLVNVSSNQLQYFEAYELIEQMKINYIMIDKNRHREFEWFNNDKNHFSKEFENEIIAIFKVNELCPPFYLNDS